MCELFSIFVHHRKNWQLHFALLLFPVRNKCTVWSLELRLEPLSWEKQKDLGWVQFRFTISSILHSIAEHLVLICTQQGKEERSKFLECALNLGQKIHLCCGTFVSKWMCASRAHYAFFLLHFLSSNTKETRIVCAQHDMICTEGKSFFLLPHVGAPARFPAPNISCFHFVAKRSNWTLISTWHLWIKKFLWWKWGSEQKHEAWFDLRGQTLNMQLQSEVFLLEAHGFENVELGLGSSRTMDDILVWEECAGLQKGSRRKQERS